MNPPKVSVIVPAFNAERYLERCLNSIACQTMPEYECIVVDDGSTDKTGQIADTFAKNDSRFKVIHKPNGGVALARQAGVDAAIGIYTIQFDADDWVEANMLEEMLIEAERTDADLVICDIDVITSSGSVFYSQKPVSFDPKVVLGLIMHDLYCSLWNKLIKRECYIKFDIRFPESKMSEDQYVLLCLCSHPIRIGYTCKTSYHYDQTQNPNALTKGEITSISRLRSLELFAESNDISAIQEYFDRAVLQIAYEVLSAPEKKCRKYSEIFKKHLPSVCRAKGYPFRVKVLVLLRIYGISIPVQSVKSIWKKIMSFN